MAVKLICVLMWLGRQVAVRAISLNFQIVKQNSISCTFTISPTTNNTSAILDLSVTTTIILRFGACNVIMHRVYYADFSCPFGPERCTLLSFCNFPFVFHFISNILQEVNTVAILL